MTSVAIIQLFVGQQPREHWKAFHVGKGAIVGEIKKIEVEMDRIRKRRTTHDFERTELGYRKELLDAAYEDLAELWKDFKKYCSCMTCRYQQMNSQHLRGRDVANYSVKYRNALATKTAGEYIRASLGNLGLQCHGDADGRIFTIEGVETCWWGLLHAMSIPISTAEQHLFDEEVVIDETYQEESKSAEEEEDPFAELEKKRDGPVQEVFRPLICEFHSEYWVYECHYSPIGGKTRIPFMSNFMIWSGPFSKWCEKRNMPRPSLSYFSRVTREDVPWLLTSKKQRFCQCDVCWQIHTNLKDQTPDDLKRLFGIGQCAHIEVVRNSRRWSNAMQILGKIQGDIVTFQMSDRMNAKSTSVPWIWRFVFLSLFCFERNCSRNC